MFGPSVIPKCHKHKTPKAQTRENRSPLRQLHRGVELTLLRCKTSSAEQQTVHTPNNCKPGTRSKQKFAFQICLTNLLFQASQSKNAAWRDTREQVISTSTPKRSETCFTMVWKNECRATDILHKIYGNDTSLPSKQKKNFTRKHWAVQHAE